MLINDFVTKSKKKLIIFRIGSGFSRNVRINSGKFEGELVVLEKKIATILHVK